MFDCHAIKFKPVTYEHNAHGRASQFEISDSTLVNRFINAASVQEILQLIFDITKKYCSVVYPDRQKIISLVEDINVSLLLPWLKSKLPDPVRFPSNETLLFLDYENQGGDEHVGALLSCLDEKESCLIIMWDIDINKDSRIADYNYLFLLMKIFLKQSKCACKNHNDNKESNGLLQLLLEDHSMTEDDISKQTKKFGYQFNSPSYGIIVTAFSLKDDARKLTLSIEDNLRQFTPFFEFAATRYQTIGGITKKNDLFFIVSSEKMENSQQVAQVKKIAQALHKNLAERYYNLTFTSGIGFMQDMISKFHVSYRQAYTALRHTLSLPCKGTIQHFMDMGVFRLLLYRSKQPQLKSFLMDHFEPLLSMERENVWPLLETMYSYIICGFNFRECARKIHVHHNTVHYRLKKIESLCNLDLEKPADLVTTLVCLEILKLCPEYTQQIHNLESKLTAVV